MTDHPHIATPYELKASAEQRLKAIAFPLLPEPKWDDSENIWKWRVPKMGTTIGWNLHFNMQVQGFPYQVGDRIYLQEEWRKAYLEMEGDEGSFSYFRKEPSSGLTDWQPANTMPPDAARHWFAIAEVKVCQCEDLTWDNMESTGILSACPGIDYPDREAAMLWNAAYPNYPWNRDRWVVALRVEAISL